ncbi:hypothetical protein BJ322DRAFT_759990 [Thelephora terrestris]|uniref:Uncharacterized protein n=1 Tax=Thelephora terrestris TaxID=56493 RepID=A0A9P6HIA3_9AGAM|nr:hypothetical protein BJ322DRAFT_759990 [Thelephora terrestris]
MSQTQVDIISSRCFICEDDESIPCSPAPSIPDLDVQFSDAETTVVNEFLEDIGLAPVEVPRHMVPPYFAAGYDLRGYASLDVFEDLRVQATYFPFMPVNYIHWIDYAIPLSRFFFVDEKWISWGHARRWDQEDKKQYEEWEEREAGHSVDNDNESLDTEDDCSYNPQPSPYKRPSRVPLGLFSIPSMENTKRRRTIYHARPPLIKAHAVVGDEFGRTTKWQSTSSFSSTSEISQLPHQKYEEPDAARGRFRMPAAVKLEDIQERLKKVFYAST